MFERMTERTRSTVAKAQSYAQAMCHDAVGTEHLLLAMFVEPEQSPTVASTVLERLGLDYGTTRAAVLEHRPRGEKPSPPNAPFTPSAKKMLDLALREALQLGHNYIGTEHLLLGLVREGEGIGAQVLIGSGVDLARVRQEVISVLGGYGDKTADERKPSFPGFKEPKPTSDLGDRIFQRRTKALELALGSIESPQRAEDLVARARVFDKFLADG